MLQAEARFISKHNVVQLTEQCTIDGASACGLQSSSHSSQSFPWFSKAFGLLGPERVFVSGGGNNVLCSSLRVRLGCIVSLLGFLVSSLITRDSNMTWEAVVVSSYGTVG
ncbi:hypothetical protein TNCV_2228431 [Trichonephila clavipes]|nr:hypothetical protein TNCV_2228431 [Trichonephila clavipes]